MRPQVFPVSFALVSFFFLTFLPDFIFLILSNLTFDIPPPKQFQNRRLLPSTFPDHTFQQHLSISIFLTELVDLCPPSSLVSPKRGWSGAGVGVGMLRVAGNSLKYVKINKFLGFVVSWNKISKFQRFNDPISRNFHFMLFDRY